MSFKTETANKTASLGAIPKTPVKSKEDTPAKTSSTVSSTPSTPLKTATTPPATTTPALTPNKPNKKRRKG